MAATWPQIPLEVIYHVGSLNPADKTRWSYEGRGLSVSVHPHDWEAIAGLGGQPTWQLTRPGGCFVDAHALDRPARAVIVEWGLQAAWVRTVDAFEVSWYDGDLDSEVRTIFADRAEAQREADLLETTVTTRKALAATDAFDDLTVPTGTLDPLDALYAAYVAEELPHYDGLWWADTYDPANLSCPRGVISLHAVARWGRQQIARAQRR